MFYVLMEQFGRYTSEDDKLVTVTEDRVIAVYDEKHFNDAIASMMLCEWRHIWNVGITLCYYVAEWKENAIMEQKIVAIRYETCSRINDEYMIPEDFLA